MFGCRIMASDYRNNLIVNVHENLSLPESGKTLFVDGDYEYWHYGCDGFNDQGWGCGYRTLQTICSWIKKKTVTDKSVPSIKTIQEVLVSLEDKEESFAGSREWIGSFEICLVLDHLFNVPCKILHVPCGSDLKNQVTIIEKHFEECASPIMMGGDRDCSSKCIVAINIAAKDTYFLIVDPHFVGKAKFPEQIHQSWVKWRSVTDFIDSSFYNLCLPQLKRDVIETTNK